MSFHDNIENIDRIEPVKDKTFWTSPHLDSSAIGFIKNPNKDALVENSENIIEPVLNYELLKQDEFLPIFLNSLYFSKELPEEFYFILNQIFMHIFEKATPEDMFSHIEGLKKDHRPSVN